MDTTERELNEDKLTALIAEKRSKENFPLAVFAGFAGALVGGAIWAGITVATEFQIGWMAVGVGFLVGFSVRFMGKGISPRFGYVGAAFALLGCLAGNFLSIVGFVAIAENLGFFQTLLSIDYAVVPEIMVAAFSPIDLLFYGIAVYEGYKFSFVQISENEIKELTE